MQYTNDNNDTFIPESGIDDYEIIGHVELNGIDRLNIIDLIAVIVGLINPDDLSCMDPIRNIIIIFFQNNS